MMVITVPPIESSTATPDDRRSGVVRRSVRLLVPVAQSDLGIAPQRPGGLLPYRADLLSILGFDVVPTASRPGRLDRVLSAVRMLRSSAGSVANVAVFESEGHVLAAMRSVVPRRLRRTPLVVVSCWLGELVTQASWWRRWVYKQIYRGADVVTVFSRNQVLLLEGRLGIPTDRLVAVPFGVDVDELDDVPTSDAGTVVAVGRDLGRDWRTFLTAVSDSGWPVRIATRQRQLQGLTVPENVDVLGTVSRADYLQLLAAASVIAVITDDLAYPTGQSVLLEAMVLGKACVVTSTPAMSEYLQPGVTCLTVEAGDADGVRDAIAQLMADGELRARIGSAARADAHARFRAANMWSAIAREIDRVVA